MLDTQRIAADLLAVAAEAHGEGDYVAASTYARAALQADPSSAAACNLIGLAEFDRSAHAEAAAYLKRAAILDPTNAEYPNNLGFVLHALGELDEARQALERALAVNPLMAHAANNLGSVLEKAGDDTAAIALYRRALQIDPAFVEARDNLLLVCARVAPQWHFPMMADGLRNAAYAKALAKVAARQRVLDIGSGSGLLAMMAVQAGAAQVVTCEMQPVIAQVAKAVTAANGLAGKISVWPMKSDQLELGRELLARAQVLVTETFSSGLISEGVLPTVEDAHRRLLEPDAVVIPRRAGAVGYLIGGAMLEQHLFAGTETGFDLSAFDMLAPGKLGMHLDRTPHQALSADFEIFGFDLKQRHFPPERRRFEIEATAAGRCIGVAQWIRLDLDADTVYENRPTPDAGPNGWMHVIYRFARPLTVAAGDRVPLVAGHNRISLTIGLDERVG
jgi:tetratricopeptide (TPR) repeat protein